MCVFFSSGIISVFVFGGLVGARRITYGYSIEDVTATWIEVNLVSPFSNLDAVFTEIRKYVYFRVINVDFNPFYTLVHCMIER